MIRVYRESQRISKPNSAQSWRISFSTPRLSISFDDVVIEILKQQLQLDTQAVSDFQSNSIILEAYERTANFLQGLYVQAGQRLKEEVTQPESQELTSAIQQLQRGIDAMRVANDLQLANTSEAKLKSVDLWLAR